MQYKTLKDLGLCKGEESDSIFGINSVQTISSDLSAYANDQKSNMPYGMSDSSIYSN